MNMSDEVAVDIGGEGSNGPPALDKEKEIDKILEKFAVAVPLKKTYVEVRAF